MTYWFTSKSLEDHVKHLTSMLKLLRSNVLYAKKSKYYFGVHKVEYLGHYISGEGISTNLKKVAALWEWPVPKILKQLKGFLGLTSYYKRFIKGYG